MLYRTLSAPISVQIELTTQCTNKCPHCYNYQRQDDDPDITMSIEELRKVFDSLYDAKVFSVTLTGGEPLLQPDLVIEAIKLCKEKKMLCSINSNLTFITRETVLRMKEAGDFSVLTSIASYEEKIHDLMMGRTGAFKRTLAGIELLNLHGINFSVNMVITKMNAGQVYKTGAFAKSLGAKMFSATKATPPIGCFNYSEIQPTHEQVKTSLDELIRLHNDTGIKVDILECYPLCFIGDIEKYEMFAKRKCSAGVFSGTIAPDGQVRPCSHSNKNYGSIFNEDLSIIYSRMDEWRTGELLPQKCIECPYLARCSGGCRCEAEYAGNICGMDPYASDPSDVKLSVLKIIAKDKIKSTAIISIKQEVRFRKEEFGYILWKKNSVVVLDIEAGLLLLRLKVAKMTISEMADVSGSSIDEVSGVISGLLSKKIVSLV